MGRNCKLKLKNTRISNKTIWFYLQKYITFFVGNQVSSSCMASPIAKGSTSPGNFKNQSLSIWYFYKVDSSNQLNTYPLVNRTISPGCMTSPRSSHTDMLIAPVLSDTFTERTWCPSFVFEGLPGNNTKNYCIIFFFNNMITTLERIMVHTAQPICQNWVLCFIWRIISPKVYNSNFSWKGPAV